jgi:putative SOS response-associated peptidase YedK
MAESIDTKPAFREAFLQRRCLVPTDGFYEWKKVGTTKQPYLLTMADGSLFALAGLWERWRDPARAVPKAGNQ